MIYNGIDGKKFGAGTKEMVLKEHQKNISMPISILRDQENHFATAALFPLLPYVATLPPESKPFPQYSRHFIHISID
jgi:hypothetical protein